ncbi:hypothetical protein [Sphingomonas sp. SRS2]|uniref:hypothetical protein n=1 Tax=Sphingomonas sp. SRS2 TaxID=133190 RepID=UPI000618400D|nr:hypothetical protein [Sphingomonas sp. SRS2]KKC24847.1 hypothetical protein WP12_16550 [Sphingomonas sp. SRS2]
MGSYVMLDPITGQGDILHVHESELAANTDSGRLIPLEIEGSFRSYEIAKDGIKESYDFDVIRRPLLRRIDAEAAARRPVKDEALARVYAAKEAEARDLKGPTPFLDAEARLKDIPLKTLAARVIERAEADRAAELAHAVPLEAVRTAAKEAARQARSLAEFAAAAKIEWPTA